MNPNETLSKAFEREVEAAPYRSPTEAEIALALAAALGAAQFPGDCRSTHGGDASDHH